jgi:Protein of unknown function (DUF2752)
LTRLRRPLGSRAVPVAEAIQLEASELRNAGAALIAGGAALQLSPVHVPMACPLRTLTGIPCPLCGMTTSVEATVRLDLGTAVAAAPAGIALVAGAVAVLVLRPSVIRVPAPALYAGLAAMWVYQLFRFSIL